MPRAAKPSARTLQTPAVKATIKIGTANGTLGAAQGVLASVALGLAEQVDAMTLRGEDAPASLWKELRAAAEALAGIALEATADADKDNVAAVGLPPTVGN